MQDWWNKATVASALYWSTTGVFEEKTKRLGLIFFCLNLNKIRAPDTYIRHLKWYLGFNWVQDGTGGSNLFCARCLRKKFQKITNWLTFSWIHNTSSYCTLNPKIKSHVVILVNPPPPPTVPTHQPRSFTIATFHCQNTNVNVNLRRPMIVKLSLA